MEDDPKQMTTHFLYCIARRCSARLWSFAMTKPVRPTRRQTGRASRCDANLLTTNIVDQSGLRTCGSIDSISACMLYSKNQTTLLVLRGELFQTSNPHVRRIFAVACRSVLGGQTTLVAFRSRFSLSVRMRFLYAQLDSKVSLKCLLDGTRHSLSLKHLIAIFQR